MGGDDHTLGADVSFIDVGLVLRAGALEPAAGVRRKRDQRRHPDTRVHSVKEIGAIPIEGIVKLLTLLPDP
jgi:hypothetical protein